MIDGPAEVAAWVAELQAPPYIRIVSHRIRPGAAGEFRQIYERDVVPVLRERTGCRNAYLVADPVDQTKMLSVTVWDSRLDADKYESHGEFSTLLAKLQPTLTDLSQWKMEVGNSSSSHVATSDDVTVEGFDIDGRPRVNGRRPGAADWYVVTPGYLEALGIEAVRGRLPAASDTEDAPNVVFINETTARTVFAGEDPIGRRIRFGGATHDQQPWRTIAGVVRDVRTRGLDEPLRTEVFFPHRQFLHFARGAQARAMSLAIKMPGGDPLALVPAVRPAPAGEKWREARYRNHSAASTISPLARRTAL